MITSIVFSKDRPLQLDLCLKSLKKNFHDCDTVIVIYKYSDEYISSLEILQYEHPSVRFIEQSDSIYNDVLQIASSTSNKYICFFTDDNIFYAPIKLDNIYEQIFAAPNVSCFSFRLGKNIIIRHSNNGAEYPDSLKNHQQIQQFIFVAKTTYPYGSYWSYSHSVDGHVFRRTDIIKMFDEIEYLNQRFKFKQTPNEVESQMQKFWTQSGDFIVCLEHSSVVNSPNNRVSDTHIENFSGGIFNYDPEYLLGKYLNNKRIELSMLDFSNIRCPHQEIDIAEAII